MGAIASERPAVTCQWLGRACRKERAAGTWPEQQKASPRPIRLTTGLPANAERGDPTKVSTMGQHPGPGRAGCRITVGTFRGTACATMQRHCSEGPAAVPWPRPRGRRESQRRMRGDHTYPGLRLRAFRITSSRPHVQGPKPAEGPSGHSAAPASLLHQPRSCPRRPSAPASPPPGDRPSLPSAPASLPPQPPFRPSLPSAPASLPPQPPFRHSQPPFRHSQPPFRPNLPSAPASRSLPSA
jgi:hypothetical protein